MNPQPINYDLLRFVLEELEYIQAEWHDISDTLLRRNSHVLRSLLIHNNLQKAWNEFEFKSKCFVRSPTSIKQMRLIIGNSGIRFATTGGAVYKGSTIQSGFFVNRGMTHDQIVAMNGVLNDTLLFSLSEFIDHPVIIFNDVEYTRKEIIEFVANKLGGSHFDQRRSQKDVNLAEAMNALTINDKDLVFFELLSTGQLLLKSRHVKVLMRKIRETLS